MLFRKLIVFFTLVVTFGGVLALFYIQEVRYWLPTPVPDNYKVVQTGAIVDIPTIQTGRKKFIHFYNPNCPCSKFNFSTYKSLIRDYHRDFDCYAVIQNTTKGMAETDLSYLKKLGVKVIADQNKAIAVACGVYSTPQVVLLDEQNHLYYRGNYNKTRYCTNPATNYAQTAIDSLLRETYYLFPVSATVSYGCDLERSTD